MKAVTPVIHADATLVTFARNQQELYEVLPASVDAQSTVMTEWELSAEDLARIVNGGRIRVWLLHTGVMDGKKLTPIAVEAVE